MAWPLPPQACPWGHPDHPGGHKGQSKREEIVAGRAKENLKTSTGGSRPRPLAKLPKAETVNTRAECAKAVYFLLSDYASEITGAMLDVNGGDWVAA